MNKFIVLLLLGCVALMVVQADMPLFKLRKDVNRITFGDVGKKARYHRQAGGGGDYGYSHSHHHEDYHSGGGHYESHSSGGDDHHHHHDVGPHHYPRPKFATYFSANAKKGFGRKNKGANLNWGLQFEG